MGNQEPLRNDKSEMPFKSTITSKTDRKQSKTIVYLHYFNWGQKLETIFFWDFKGLLKSASIGGNLNRVSHSDLATWFLIDIGEK
jgi:hypothetical protein